MTLADRRFDHGIITYTGRVAMPWGIRVALVALLLFGTACGGGKSGESGESGESGGLAAPGNAVAASSSPGVTVSWTTVADPRIDGYRVYFGTVTPLTLVNATGFVDVVGAGTTSFMVPAGSLGVPSGATVQLAVSATNSVTGVESPLSNSVAYTL
jgi:hypothetical protein